MLSERWPDDLGRVTENSAGALSECPCVAADGENSDRGAGAGGRALRALPGRDQAFYRNPINLSKPPLHVAIGGGADR